MAANPAGEGAAVPVRWKIPLAILLVAEIAAHLETSLMYAALPTAMRVYGRPEHVSWLLTGYLLVGAVTAAICGRLGDLYVRSRVLFICLICCTAGSLVSTLSEDLSVIIVGRLLQGFSGAVLPLCYGLLRESAPKDKVGIGIGIFTGAGSLSASIGLVLGGMVVDAGHWQNIFILSTFLCGGATLLMILCFPASPRGTVGRISDIWGGMIFIPGVALILLAFTFKNWSLPSVSSLQSSAWLLLASESLSWIMLVGGVLLIIGWVRRELRHPDPLINVRVFEKREIVLSVLLLICLHVGVYQILQIFSILMQQPASTGIGFGLSATVTGLFKFPSNISGAIGAIVAGALCARVGIRPVALTGALMCVIAWSGLYLFHDSFWPSIVFFCMSTTGAGIGVTAAMSAIVMAVPPERVSETSGIATVLRMVAQAVGNQTVAFILATAAVGHIALKDHYPAPSAILEAMVFIVIASAVAVLVALTFGGRARAAASG